MKPISRPLLCGGILCVLILSFVPVMAQESAFPTILTWENAVAIAKEKNPDVSSARAAVEASRAAARGSLSGFLPTLSGALGVNHSDSASDPAAPSLERSMSLTAQQSLFSGFSTKASRESAVLQLESQTASLRQAEARVRENLRNAFTEVLYAQNNVLLLSKIRDRRKDNRDMIQLRYRAGRENLGSLMRADALLSRASFELEKAERQTRTARARFARTLGLPSSQSVEARGSFSVDLSTPAPDFQAAALETPEYQISKIAADRARSQLALSKADFYPSLSLTGSGKRRASDGGSESDSWSAGASVSYAFFSGAKDFESVRESRSNLEKAKADFEAVLREKEVVLEEAYTDFENALGLSAVQEEFLKASEERAKIARAQYANGLVSFQDWDLIESDLISAQKDALNARRGAVLAQAAWERAIGKGLETP